ncbi:DUF6531 domain-containing protein [Flavilitoribacter nigricans]|uniref:Type IV secretion protein Rhs n=1 Tax=Flavilitoribacter nigricans (strain ATCC 23147 / DSM 23189 / NBRC 102662 / NCIMB 1420 / SS-2) TaxID=1122177 RepID=A0A2D0N9R0_FLAN2|nr:DUF6531 domain-containing protein [Flavilitoribacter nigricans]PHN05116.1 hypothetical protein CRP01_19025 [Flavilitoribacter nigricans DSM 23189 = NBRC 102662]
MMPASKHLDIIIGIDIHIIQPPGPVPPVPIPHPFIGFLFDSGDYNLMAKAVGALGVDMEGVAKAVAKIGEALPAVPESITESMAKLKAAADSAGLHSSAPSTVWVNHLPRARAGTIGSNKPLHFPIGGTFVKGMPGNACESFMGSYTVRADKEPFTYASLPALSCQCVGMPAPPRKKGAQTGFFLPLSLVLPIPLGPLVFLGGPPIISISALAAKAFAMGLAKLRSSKLMQGVSNAIHNAAAAVMKRLRIPKGIRNLVHRAICRVTGHPVDIATGKVFTDIVDFELPGPIPLQWERVWFSTSTYEGPVGHGWHHNYDLAMGIDELNHTIVIRMADGRPVVFPTLEIGERHYNRQEKLLLLRDERGYALRDKDRLYSRFTKQPFTENEIFLLAGIENDNGFDILFTYNSKGHLTQIKDSAERILKVDSDEMGRIIAIHAPHPKIEDQSFPIVRYRYDEPGNLVETLDALDQPFVYEYQKHLLVKETNRNGLSFYFQYDGNDEAARCIRTWGDGGIYDHKLYYDTEAKQTIVENSLGHKSIHFYNDMGLVYKTIDPKGNASYTHYDKDCQVTAEINELGIATRYGYDERGNQVLIIAPDGATTKKEYNDDDLLVNATDPVDGKWRWLYDKRGNLIEKEDPLGCITQYNYENELLTEIVDPAGGITRLQYDNAYNLIQVRTPDGYHSRWGYDLMGRVTDSFDVKNNHQHRKLDLLGRVLRVDEPDYNKRYLEYDPEGNVIRAKDQHYDVHFEYIGMNRLSARIEAKTRVEFRYDTEEQLIAIKNEKNDYYRFKLDENGNVREEIGFDGLTRAYKRDEAGRITQVLRPNGLITTHEYDLADRVTGISHSDEENSKEIYIYRADGELMEASNSNISVQFERDLLGKVTKESQGGYEVHSQYDTLGMRIAVESSLGASISFERNIMGDVERVLAETSGKSWEAVFERDAFGLELQRFLPGQVTSQWRRDRLGRPLQQRTTTAGKPLRSRSYEWEVNDRLKKVIHNDRDAVRYEHDVFGNLRSATYEDGNTEYRMPDVVGNLFRSPDRTDRKYGKAGQLLEANGTKYTYDPEGNLIQKTEPSGKTWYYDWDAAGMLIRVTRPDRQVVAFRYDALGRRIAKTYLGKTTRWVWDGNTPLHEWIEPAEDFLTPVQAYLPLSVGNAVSVKWPAGGNEMTSALTTWLFEPESFSPMARFGANQQCAIVTDNLGTPTSMVDGQGELIWAANTDIYGDLRNLVGERGDCPFRFPGQYEDIETGLYYNRFRYYDRENGEYLSQDPIRLKSGKFNIYSYVKDILCWVDSLGLNELPAYENPGHHDPSTNSYISNKSVLPENHEELFKNSVPDPNNPKTRWAKEGSGKKATYHRFQSSQPDGTGPFHWNGSTNGKTKAGKSRKIKSQNVPTEIKRNCTRR